MTVADQLREQKIEKFKHCYVRYQALLAQLHAEAGVGSGSPSADLLQVLLAAYGSSGEGSTGSADAGAAAALTALLEGSGGYGSSGGGVGGSSSFARSFLQEVQRLRLFLKSSLEQLWVQLLDACAQLRALGEDLLQAGAVSAGPSQQLGMRLAVLKAGFDSTAGEVVLLEKFVRQNVAACAQLAQMHDRPHLWCHQGSSNSVSNGGSNGGSSSGGSGSGNGMAELALEAVDGAYLGCLHAALLGELRLEPLVVGLSDAYELCRLIESDAAALAGQPAKWVPPDKFQRVTRKFWLHPADVMRFKAEVIKHLPVLLFGDRQKLTEGNPYEVCFLRDQRQVSDSGEVSSVYYDNPATMPSYHVRLRKEDKASVVRVRWYGDRSLSPSQQLFVERKVHRERYTGERSYKERAPMEQRYIEQYTSGRGGPPGMLDGSSQHAEFLLDAQRLLMESSQVPMLRTVYRRTAFQEASNNLVRISLDTELHMVRELGGGGGGSSGGGGVPHVPGDWCRDMRAPLAASDAAYFPYAVVEVKLQAEPPAWLQGLLETGMLLPVPKFSKFLHGTAVLFQRRCQHVPYWFLPDENDPSLMTPATWEEMADPADEYLQKGAAWLFPQSFDAPPEPEPELPYTPAPLRFLRRNKTVPVIGSSGGSGDGSGSGRGREGTGDGPRSPATVAAAAAFDAGWANLPAPVPVVPARPAYPAAAGQLPQGPPSSAAAATAPAAGHVNRNFTWPVYQHPPPAAEDSHTIPLAPPGLPPRQLLLPGQPVDSMRRSDSPPPSQSSTPIDSAQDLESGQLQAPEHAPNEAASKPPAKCGTGTGTGTGNTQPAAALGGGAPSNFASLQYRLPGAPQPSMAPVAEAPNGRVKALVRTRVEPKTFFANERTFLQWLQISVLIMMTATSLLSGTGLLGNSGSSSGASSSCDISVDSRCFASKLSGAIIAPVALLFMAYALYMYKARTYQILRRETVRYDDQRGPVVLVIILLAVFLLSYVLAMVYIF